MIDVETNANKLDLIRTNDVEVVIHIQELLLCRDGSNGLTPREIIDLFKVYGELYHLYAMTPLKWISDV